MRLFTRHGVIRPRLIGDYTPHGDNSRSSRHQRVSPAVLYPEFDERNNGADGPLAGISSRSDFAGIIYPTVSFCPQPVSPTNSQRCTGSFSCDTTTGDRMHAILVMDFFGALLNIGFRTLRCMYTATAAILGDPLPDGSRMSGGLTHRNGIPFGTWQYRLWTGSATLDSFRNPGFEAKAAKDITTYINQPPPPERKQQ